MDQVHARDPFMSCDQVEAAVAEDERLLDATSSVPRSQRLFNLARSLHARHRCQGASGDSPADLGRAIDCLSEALEEIPPLAPVRQAVLSELASYLAQRGGPGDADRAAQLNEEVLRSMPAGSVDRGIALASSAEGYFLRFSTEMRPALLDEAIRLNELAIADVPLSHPQGAVLKANLAMALATRFQLTKLPGDLDRAVQLLEGLRENPAGRIVLTRPEFAANLAQLINIVSLFAADERLVARLRDLTSSAAGAGRATADFGQPPPAAGALAKDAEAAQLFLEYQRAGREQDLHDAVRTQRDAVRHAPTGMAAIAVRVRLNLAMMLFCRYLLGKETPDLEEAVRLGREAADLAVNDHDRGVALMIIGACLMQEIRRVSRPGIGLVDEAMSTLERAQALLGQDALLAPGLASCLGDALLARAMITRDVAAADRAVELFKVMRDADPETFALAPGTALVLAQALQDRAELSGRPADITEADDASRAACASGALATLPNTFQMAASWGETAWRRQSWSVAGEAYSAAVRALYDLARTQVAREQSETALRAGTDTAARAAYALTESRSATAASDAAEIIEAGRAVLFSAALERSRLDLEELGRQQSGLARDYRAAVTELNRAERAALAAAPGPAAMTPVGLAGAEALMSHLSAARKAFEHVVTHIQVLSGYEQFLSLPELAVIGRAAGPAEPLVYLAATNRGGVGVVVPADGTPHAIRLPELTAEAVSRHVNLLRQMTSSEPMDESVFEVIATWMWRSAMRDVLEKLAGSPTVTLIPTGLLGLLPWHAAGEQGADGWHFALDQAVFRYAPNARALTVARRAASQARELPVLLIADPTGDLPGALKESDELGQVLAADDISMFKGREADRDSTLRAMPGCGTLYFAGHALAAIPPQSALESHLLVADGVISVRDLLSEDLRHMRLAVLSACESARVSTELPDEVVALPASLMQAGAAGVIGSLWPVSDRAALKVMRGFAEMWHIRRMPPAEALCQAQRLVRGSVPGRPQPLAWAAFTFTGA
jgi:CHAT domain